MTRRVLIPIGFCVACSTALVAQKVTAEFDDTVERALTAKGLTKATGASDLNVFFTLGSRGVIEREEVPPGPRGLRTRVVNKYPPKK